MKYIGLSDSATNWVESYLTNRLTFVEIEGYRSSEKDIKCGVPQGSILGPLLFLIYVNDMSQSVTCNLFLYADDSWLIVTHKAPAHFRDPSSVFYKFTVCSYVYYHYYSVI